MKRLAIAAILLAAAGAAADTVYLRDGRVVQGKATRQDGTVLIETALGSLQVDANDVILITPGSMPSDPASAPAPLGRALVSTESRRPLPTDQITHPEPMVLSLMRNLSAATPGMDTYHLRQQIEQWRAVAHDRKRKVGADWIAPAEFARRRLLFSQSVKEADDLLKKIRLPTGAAPNDPRVQAARRAAMVPVLEKLDAAARAWGDPLLRNFLTGIVAYHRDEFVQAETFFRKCIDEEPLVAAFHQGRGLALLGRDRAIWGLEELLAALGLRPDSRDLLASIQDAMKKVPGTSIKDPVYSEAVRLLALYSENDRRTSTSQDIAWLMPGREWQVRGESLPTPPYDRLIVRQALAVAVGKNTLLVDSAAVKDALDLVVRIDTNTVAPAYAKRSGFSTRGAPALATITVPGVEFSVPRLVEDGNAVPSPGVVSAWTVPFWGEMGSFLRKVPGKTGGAASDGSVIVSILLSPGDSAAPVFLEGGGLIGFLAAKTDIAADGGGPDRFIPLSQFARVLKQIKDATPDHSTFGRLRRTATTRPASGEVFLVTGIAGEKLE